MKFNMQTRCKPCKGTGLVESSITTEGIFAIVMDNLQEGEVNKIPAIKQVRDEYGMGLKEAKELVEGAMAFYMAIQNHASDSELSQYEENEVPW